MGAKFKWLAPICLSLYAWAMPAQHLRRGAILPVRLDRPLDARKAHPGQQIRLEVMQKIRDSQVRRHSHVLGHVVSVKGMGDGPAEITLRFDSVEQRGMRIPFSASVRALASWMEVEEANAPEEALGRGMTPETATYRQIGGEEVYRGGGPVAAGLEVVGRPTPYGVLARPRANVERGCGGAVGGNQPQPLWVFSTNACGVYGFPGLHIAHAGRTNPVGEIVLQSDSGRLHLPTGTGMLLRVQQAQPSMSFPSKLPR
jgi:hypothetical protein